MTTSNESTNVNPSGAQEQKRGGGDGKTKGGADGKSKEPEPKPASEAANDRAKGDADASGPAAQSRGSDISAKSI